MGFLKKNIKWIIVVIVGIIITSGVSVYATASYLATQVNYTRNDETISVKQALDDLYTKVPSGTQNITANGTYDISNKESVNVNVTTVAGTKTLLWTNPSPNSSFASQTITLSSSLSNYTHLLIQWKNLNTSSVIYDDIFSLSPSRNFSSTETGVMSIAGTTDSCSSNISRIIAVYTNTSLKVGAGKKSGGTTIDNTKAIPVNVYGLNFSY